MDRAFGVDKHSMANHTLIIYWSAAQQRFQEHKQKCSSERDLSLCDELIEVCSEAVREISNAKKGFGVFAYDKNFFSAKLQSINTLVFQLECTYPDNDKIAELIIETNNILERRYR